MSQKVFLILSPQPWNHIPVSKHNYALTLARRGYRVIFVNPPIEELKQVSLLETTPENQQLEVLSYRRASFFPLRFHLPLAFDFFMGKYIRTILNEHCIKPDFVWCFDFNLFSDLRAFPASKRIYHPVDPLSHSRHLKPAQHADLVLTVSQNIAHQLEKTRKPIHVINHGLATPFEDAALRRLKQLIDNNDCITTYTAPDRPKVGYAGNLTRQPVNRNVIRRIVQESPHAEFHFWGPHQSSDSTISEFVSFLKAQPNVKLHGAVNQDQLANAYQAIDIFLLSYKRDLQEYDLSNSHKLLEYISTGRTVVSSRIQTYTPYDHLITMPDTDSDETLPSLFLDALANLNRSNTKSLQIQRINLALENTYSRQLDRILDLLAKAKAP
jgi:hypothetical protein